LGTPFSGGTTWLADLVIPGSKPAPARLKLAPRKKPYAGPSLARGVSLLYRRNKKNGA
jgi:hypothetical protein